ncbi:MAG: TonB-dependent receptor [Alphaproteobacteria bacterium]|nr:TonB-dependent receptor [Alphaproteobacteria bacterium]
MISLYRTILLGGTALALTTTVALAQDAAPPPAADEAGKIEKVTVTARRTKENQQKVPASVSSFSEKSLDRIGATDVTGLQGAIPNANIAQGRGSSNATNIYIRGVGQPDALQTFDPAVGVYVDDVYLSRIRGTQFELMDIERLEVLRGPQGTLYGKNTIGGALKVITRRPTDESKGAASFTVGSYGELVGNGTISGGLTDTLAASASLLIGSRDGYVENPVTDAEYNDRGVGAGRVKLAWDPSEDFQLDVSFDYAEEDAALNVGQATNTLTTILGVPLLVVPATPPEFNFETRTTPGLPNSTEMTHWGGSASATWDLDDAWTLRSITAYRELQNRDYVDIDATQLELGDVLVDVDQNQTSQELQLLYAGTNWQLVSGLYYLRENIVSHQEAYADDYLGGFLGGNTFLRTVDDDLQTTSWAAFANAVFALTDTVNLSTGIRYTEEEKEYFRTTSTFSNSALFNGTFAFSRTESWENVSPMVSLDWQANDNTLLYARYATGFKSGGFNGRANAAGEDQPYDPETLDSYEVGVKSDWADGTVRTNITAFYNDYTDFQARVSRSVTSPTQPIPAIDFAVLNAGGLEIYGAELEFLAYPVPELRLDASIGYLHAEYTEFFEVRAGPVTIDRSWQTPAFSPEWTMRFGGQYEWSLGDMGSLTLGAAARFRSEMALAVDNANLTSRAIFPGMWQDDFWVYDAQLVWANDNETLLAGLYARNLSDEVYKTDAQEFSSVAGIRTAYYGAPQTVSFKITVRY